MKKNKDAQKLCMEDVVKFPSLINIGSNPTFSGRKKWIETHLIDFGGDIYNEKIRVYFFRMLREEKKFRNKEELSKQIKHDLNKAGKYFK